MLGHPASASTPTVGVLAAWQLYEGATIDGYLRMLFEGICQAARDRGCNLLLSCGVAPPSPRRLLTPGWPVVMPDAQFVPVGPWNTNGLIVVPNGLSAERLMYLQNLRADGHPVVFAGAPELAPTVAVDNASGIDQALSHLVLHGHRRIAFIGGPPSRPGDGAERLEAYHAGLQRLGLDSEPLLVAHSDQADDIESGRQAMAHILTTEAPFSALLTYNDWVAIGAMESLRAAGLRIPDDVAVIGFDDRLPARVQRPPLTTVRHPTAELGYQSLAALLDLMAGRWDGHQPIRIPTRLVVRQSCGCLPGRPVHAPTIRASPRPAQEGGTSWVARRMAEAAAAEARQVGVDELETSCLQLLEALASSISSGDRSEFNRALTSVLQGTLDRNEDVYIWHAAISALEEAGSHESGSRTAALWDAHPTISEQSRRQITTELLREMDLAERLGLMTSQLLAVLDAEQIAAALAEHLPVVGIRHLQVALYVGEEDDPVAASQSALRCGVTGPEPSGLFITRHFSPAGLYQALEPCQLALLPLIIQGANVGFVAADASNLEPLAVIMRNLASAVQSSQLYRDAAEGRRLAEEASRLKTRFLSTVSHELRTPLSVIVGLSELMLKEQAQGAAPAQEDLERIFASAQHLGFLIRDVLDLASSDAGRLRLTYEPLDLVEALRPIAATGEQLALDKGLEWRVRLPEATPPVWGDRTRLRQVALNFITNAVKFTPRGTVTLAIGVDERAVTVSVSDTGLGIPCHEQSDIFDEFRQSERTAGGSYGGLGLGLAISKHLVELHGGEIGVHSSGDAGEGATFYFCLPVMAAQPAAAEPFLLPAQPAALVLTDEPQAGDMIRSFLQREGFPVVTRIVTPEADWIKQVRQAAPAAVLIDRRLATARAWEIAQQLKQDTALQSVPVLFYSLPTEGEAGGLLELDFRAKPLERAQLEQIIAPVAHSQRQSILIVDDSPDVLDVHTRMVRQQLPECDVLQARHGREALALLQRVRPDLILLDLMMPELDGFGVLEALQVDEALRQTPVVVLTARTLTEADMARLNQGVVSVLEKGVLSIDETLARVVEVLARADRPRGVARRVVRRAMAYLHEHYGEPVSREQIARHVGVSESFLANAFHQELGLSPMIYLNRYRIRQARGLLEKGELNVTEVALAVGFSDSAYFGRVFQREVGVSPGAYRRGQRPG